MFRISLTIHNGHISQTASIGKDKKGTVYPKTVHEGPEGE
jgi:hypothetical protein